MVVGRLLKILFVLVCSLQGGRAPKQAVWARVPFGVESRRSTDGGLRSEPLPRSSFDRLRTNGSVVSPSKGFLRHALPEKGTRGRTVLWALR